MKTSGEHQKPRFYLLLLAIQIFGAIVFVWQQLPEFRQVAVNPGAQLPHDTFSDLVMVGILCVMQISFGSRVRHFPIPFRQPNVVLNHVFLFWAVSVLSLAARYFLSSCSGICRSLAGTSTCRWRPAAAS